MQANNGGSTFIQAAANDVMTAIQSRRPRRTCARCRRRISGSADRATTRCGDAAEAVRCRSTCRMRPGDFDIITTLSDRKTASSTEWVTNSTVLRSRSQMFQEIILEACTGVRVERAERLVHQQNSSGWSANVRASATRCFMPPDSSLLRKKFFIALGGQPSRSGPGSVLRPQPGRHTLLARAIHHIAQHGLPGKQSELLKHRSAIRTRPRDRPVPSSFAAPLVGLTKPPTI